LGPCGPAGPCGPVRFQVTAVRPCGQPEPASATPLVARTASAAAAVRKPPRRSQPAGRPEFSFEFRSFSRALLQLAQIAREALPQSGANRS